MVRDRRKNQRFALTPVAVSVLVVALAAAVWLLAIALLASPATN